MLTFVLPEGHGYVKFKATVGYDDDVKDAAEGVTMEFRVFTEDPAPGEASPVALDLVQLGFAADQPCRVKEMWKGKDVGYVQERRVRPHSPFAWPAAFTAYRPWNVPKEPPLRWKCPQGN